jgi:hypothetical protein
MCQITSCEKEPECLGKKLKEYPQRTFKNGKREYIVTFLPGSLAGENDSPRVQLGKWKEFSQEWGIFCYVDIETIDSIIELNPNLVVLNLLTQNPDTSIFGSMYKIIRIK